MAKNFFITGTDTDSGKTLVTAALLHKASQQGLQSLGLKPIAAGAELIEQQLQNDDARLLMRHSSVKLAYQQVNPVVFAPPIAPHIAAEQSGTRVTIRQLVGFVRGAMLSPADFRCIEGAGGWLVPVNSREPLSQLAVSLELPVILVVGVKLGCINHAMLTAAAIARDGLQLAGWVATQLDPNMLHYAENLQTLQQILPAPCLGTIPFLDLADDKKVTAAAEFITLPMQ